MRNSPERRLGSLVRANVLTMSALLVASTIVLVLAVTARTYAMIDSAIEYELNGFLSYGCDSSKVSSDMPSGLLPIIYIDTEEGESFNPHPNPVENIEHSRQITEMELAEGFQNVSIGSNHYRVKKDVYEPPLAYYRGSEGYKITETVFIRDITSDVRMIENIVLVSFASLVCAVAVFSLFNYRFSNVAMREVEKALERQKKFAADASHELRNPLAIIKINLELLRGAKSKPNMDDETQERLTSAALEGVGKMQMVLDDLLVIARASDLDESFFAEKLNLGDVVSSVARDCEPLCEAKGIALTYRCDSKCEVFGDAALLRDMVSVVLDNAILYTERGGAVEVVVDGESPVCGVSVSDTGIGMTEEDVVRVFDRFYRGEAGKVANPSGSGLGIPVAHEIAQRHNAEMRIKSAPGAGTTVSFSFPKR